MLFTSLVFLCIFLPLILVVYYLTPKFSKNYVLLLFSLVFYAWGGVSYSLILIISIIVNYCFAVQIGKSDLHKKQWLIGGLLINVITLFVFKYLDFFIENVNLFGSFFNTGFGPLPQAKIVLPLGISFFTFQEMSMLWDIYRAPNRKPIRFFETALYVSFFPQLIAGPIVRYDNFIHQIKQRVNSIELVNSGIRKFILGLFKKVILANTCASIADSIMDNPINDLSTPVAWLGIIAYAFQIYFDFSGYSDMAIGLGRIFGFRIPENFNFPYIARSIKEFWRRWHISLSSWFKDYVYIPLGGNRKGYFRTYFNLLLVFLLTGFWHGATWSFIFWGVFHGAFLILERIGLEKILLTVPRIFSWAYTMLVILIGWVFFRIEHFPDALKYVHKLFGGGTAGTTDLLRYLNPELMIVLLIAAISSTTLLVSIQTQLLRVTKGKLQLPAIILRDWGLLLLFFYCILHINSGSYNPFIYFRF